MLSWKEYKEKTRDRGERDLKILYRQRLKVLSVSAMVKIDDEMIVPVVVAWEDLPVEVRVFFAELVVHRQKELE